MPLRWKIYAVIFNLVMVLGLATMIVQGDKVFEICRNFASGALGSLGLLFYAFNLEGIPAKAWKFIFWYCVADAVYDLFYLFKTEGVLTTVIGYPFEILVLFPMFLAIFRLAFVPKSAK
jgi:hypothetical protein